MSYTYVLDGNNNFAMDDLPEEFPQEFPPQLTDDLRLSPMSIGSMSPPLFPLGFDDLSLKSPKNPVKRRRSAMEASFSPIVVVPPKRKVEKSLMGARISELLSTRVAQCFRDLLGPWGGVAWGSCCRATRTVLYSWRIKIAYIWGELNGVSWKWVPCK